ncbi:MAG: ParB/RepB/Spo0J family partition protein [Anaerovoracaceae bacterium]|jgi:ParB family chromosome partitioning protein
MTPKSPKNRGLGRGLDALFAEQKPVIEPEQSADGESPDEEHVVYIDINEIKPNKNQPRKEFNQEKIAELADSIREHGIIQPLVLRKSEGSGYELVAGERRWRAARQAGLSKVPCLIRDFTDEQNMLVAIIENLQREDLNPIEEAEGLEQMIQTYGFTQEEVSRSVSKSRPYISNSLRLLKLPEEIRSHVVSGELTAGHARALINVDADRQKELCDKVIREGLTVRQLEKLITSKKNGTARKPAKKRKPADVIRMEAELREKYGTKVTINSKGKKGTIELEYYNRDDLNRILELLNG